MAIICESILWPLLKAIKPKADKHTFDVLPMVWTKAREFFTHAASRPRGLIEGSLKLDLGDDVCPPDATPRTDAQLRRSQRAAIDMTRIRAKIQGDQQQFEIVEKLLAAACTAMIRATENHDREWLGPDGKLCAEKITPELRAIYDALPTPAQVLRGCMLLGAAVMSRQGCSALTRAPACVSRATMGKRHGCAQRRRRSWRRF